MNRGIAFAFLAIIVILILFGCSVNQEQLDQEKNIKFTDKTMVAHNE
jgi:hypothetical protein